MKKTLLIVAVLAISVLTLGLAGYAYAQDQTPESPYGFGMMGNYDGHGPEMMGEAGDFGHGMMGWNGAEGPMHDGMVASLAGALGLSVDEIETRHDAGETIWDIAENEGLSSAEIQDLMFASHDTAIEDAVANGLLTQEESEWMDSHMEEMWDGEGGHCGRDSFEGSGTHRGGMNW